MSTCVVVGAGLIGMLTARELVEAGLRVTVLEKSEPARESSWAGGGILSPLYPWRYPDAVDRLAQWSQRYYPEFCQRLADNTGIDPQWTQCGLLIADIDDRPAARAWVSGYAGRSEWPDAQAMRVLEPQLGDAPQNGLWLPEVAQIRNPRLACALRAEVERLGVEIRTQTPVTGWNMEGRRLRAVATPQGEVSADLFVVAGGAWSGELLEATGVHLPIRPVRGQMLLFKGAAGLVSRIVLYQGHYAIPRRDGHVLFGSTMEDCGFDKRTTSQAREELHHLACELLPCLSGLPVVKHWAGLRPASPDGTPMIGPHPGLDNLFINAGHFRNGVILGLASARLLADQLLERPPVMDKSCYLPEIFIK